MNVRQHSHRSGGARRSRLVRVVAAVAALVVAVGAIAVVGRGGGGRPEGVRFLPRPLAAEPSADVVWWAPVRGEPLGVAVDGSEVAAAALDEVRLLDVGDGRTRWKASVPGVRRYRPAVWGDRVVATGETELVLLDRGNGARVAAVPFSGPGPAALVPGPDGTVLAAAGSEVGELLVVDAADGTLRWTVRHPGEIAVAPAGDGASVVASWHDGSGSTVRAFAADTGALRWEARLGAVAGPPSLVGSSVVVAHGPGIHSAVVQALDTGTGAQRWQVALPGWWDVAIEPAARADGVYLLDGMGTVVALDPATGGLRWRQETGRPLVAARLALTSDAVVFASYDDELMVLERADGRLRAAEPQRGVPVDVAASRDRIVVALRLATPSRVEARPVP